MKFESQLKIGRVAEGLIARWLIERGASVMPVYEIEVSHGKGPQLFRAGADLVAPDMLVFNSKGICWVESKHKSVFSWHRLTQKWTTGIDLRHYEDYIEVAKQTDAPVWLMFFHRESKPSANDAQHGCPAVCPTGLFAGDLAVLVLNENHRSPPHNGSTGHGKTGMVYWAVDKLKHLGTKEDVARVASSIGVRSAA